MSAHSEWRFQYTARIGLGSCGEDTTGRDADIFRYKTFHFAAAETPMTLYDVYNADEAFLTGSGAELIPIAEVDGRRLHQAPGLVV